MSALRRKRTLRSCPQWVESGHLCYVPNSPEWKERLMPIGTVKFFNADKGYGFIAPEDGGNDAFVHITAVERAGMRTLQKDQRLSYELEEDRRGKMSAVNLQSA